MEGKSDDGGASDKKIESVTGRLRNEGYDGEGLAAKAYFEGLVLGSHTIDLQKHVSGSKFHPLVPILVCVVFHTLLSKVGC